MAGQVWYEEVIFRQFWPHFFPLQVAAENDMEQNNRLRSILHGCVSDKETFKKVEKKKEKKMSGSTVAVED